MKHQCNSSIYISFVFSIIFILLSNISVIGQTGGFDAVNRLSLKLSKDKENDGEKVKSFYDWIGSHIAYDVKVFKGNLTRKQSAKSVLRRRKAVCDGYSNLLTELCKAAKIPAEVVTGYAKGFDYRPGDRFYYQNHSWTAVYYDSSWHLMDPTWGAGFVIRKPPKWKVLLNKVIFVPYIHDKYKFIKRKNNRYFNSSPDWFVISHLPVHPMWQLKSCPVSYSQFESSAELKPDSIACFENYAFTNDIQYYRSLGKGEKLRYLGDKGKLYNHHGNIVKADYYHLFNKSLNKALLTPDLTSLDTTLKYSKKFFPDNNKLYKYNKDTINKRTALHLSQLRHCIANNKRAFHTTISELRSTGFQLSQIEKLIKVMPDLNKRRVHKNIEKTGRPRTSSSQKKRNKKIALIKSKYDKDVNKIDSLKNQFFRLSDSLGHYNEYFNGNKKEIYESRLNVWASLIFLYSLHQQLASPAEIETQFSILLNHIHHIDSIRKADRHLQKTVRHVSTLQNRTGKNIVMMSNRNLIAIKRIKSQNYYEQKEDIWFKEDQEKLRNYLDSTLPAVYKQREDTELKIDWLLNYASVVKKEKKVLRRDKRVIGKWHRNLLNNELKRYKGYNQKALQMINETKSWMRMTKKKTKRK